MPNSFNIFDLVEIVDYQRCIRKRLSRICEVRQTFAFSKRRNHTVKLLVNADRKVHLAEHKKKGLARKFVSRTMGQGLSDKVEGTEVKDEVYEDSLETQSQAASPALPAAVQIKQDDYLSHIPTRTKMSSKKRQKSSDETQENEASSHKRTKLAAESKTKKKGTKQSRAETKPDSAVISSHIKKVVIRSDQSNFPTNTDHVCYTNDEASIRQTLLSQFYITIPTEDITIKHKRLVKLATFFEAFSPIGVYSGLMEWFIVFGSNEKSATECFKHYMLRDYRGVPFRMELIGPGGESLLRCKKQILEAGEEFDESWVGFELLRMLDVVH